MMRIVDLPAWSFQVDSLLKRSSKGDSEQQEVIQSFCLFSVMVEGYFKRTDQFQMQF